MSSRPLTNELISAARPGTSGGRLALDVLAIFLLALIVRVVGLQLAGQDSLDHALRIWIARRWLEDPFLLLHGVWPPLHFYLIAGALRVLGDDPLAPVIVHVLIGALVAPLVWLFAWREFKTRSGALAAGASMALYPAAILNSLSV